MAVPNLSSQRGEYFEKGLGRRDRAAVLGQLLGVTGGGREELLALAELLTRGYL